jgi:hypothetical protein
MVGIPVGGQPRPKVGSHVPPVISRQLNPASFQGQNRGGSGFERGRTTGGNHGRPAHDPLRQPGRLGRLHLRLWHAGANPVDLAPTGADEFGPLWELSLVRPELTFTFTASPGAAQTDGHDRRVRPLVRADGGLDPGQVWCRGDRAFVYPVRPADPQPEPAGDLLERLAADPGFSAGLELPSTGGRSGQGANLLADGRVLFGLYHRPRPACWWPAASTTGSTPATSGLTPTRSSN